MRADYDVIIVGAGAAGLAAGAKLAQAGQRVALLEARDRIGGRIFTQHLPAAESRAPMCIELGAEFIHGLPSTTWSLVGQAKLSAYELEGADISFVNGNWAPPMNYPAATRVIANMMSWLDAPTAAGAQPRSREQGDPKERLEKNLSLLCGSPAHQP